MTRYDFPTLLLAVERAKVRARRRGQPVYVIHNGDGFSITFQKPEFALVYREVSVKGEVITVARK